jgi:hypothetical protein
MSDTIIHATTPEEAARLDRLAALAEGERDEIVESLRLHRLAAAQPTFVGAVLREIMRLDVDFDELAALAGLDQAGFDDFRCGRIELPAAAFERVARRLGFTLVRSAEPAGV